MPPTDPFDVLGQITIKQTEQEVAHPVAQAPTTSGRPSTTPTTTGSGIQAWDATSRKPLVNRLLVTPDLEPIREDYIRRAVKLGPNGRPIKRLVKKHRPEDEDAQAQVKAGAFHGSELMAEVARRYTGSGEELVLHALRIMRDELWMNMHDPHTGVRWIERVRVPIREQQAARQWLGEIIKPKDGAPAPTVNVAVQVKTLPVQELSDAELQALLPVLERYELTAGPKPDELERPAPANGGGAEDGAKPAEAAPVHDQDVP